MTIESVVLLQYVRVAPGANGEQHVALDTKREAHRNLRLEETAHGVQVYRDGALFTLIPWPIVRQVVYAADAVTVPATPTAKAK